MPLGARDVLFIMRARDEASRTLATVGAGMAAVGTEAEVAGRKSAAIGAGMTAFGTGLAAIGAAGVAFYVDAYKAAINYNQQSALTLTQVDQLGVSLEDIKRIGREVAAEIPVPFEQMQTALYDIFSSMDVSIPEAQDLLTSFSKAAVAGQTDVQTAARGAIAVLNAYHLPASQVNDVLDLQFRLVQKGVGTYEEFASVIGRVIPSAINAGQQFNQVGGAMSFLTRNGLSAAMAATSTARAMDALANPKTLEKLKKMGIAFSDANGQMLPMDTILANINDRVKNLSPIDKSAFISELLKGSGGTIQARRFFNEVFNNFDEYELRVGEFVDSAGSMQEAYDTMFNQPQSMWTRLQNNWDIIKTEVGDAVTPIFGKLLDVGERILGWFNNLDPQLRNNIIRWGLFISVGALVVGSITAIVGAFTLLSGLLASAGTSITAIIASFTGWIIVIGAATTAIVLAYQNWKPFHDFVDALGQSFLDAANWVKEFADALIHQDWDKARQLLSQLWDNMVEAVKVKLPALLTALKQWVENVALPWIRNEAPTIAGAIVDWFEVKIQDLWTAFNDYILTPLEDWYNNTFYPWIDERSDSVQAAIVNWFKVAPGAIGTALGSIIPAVWGWLQENWLLVLWPQGYLLINTGILNWFRVNVPKLIGNLAEWLANIANWIYKVALPWLDQQAPVLEEKFLKWVEDAAKDFPAKAAVVSLAFANWVYDVAIPWWQDHAPQIAAAVLVFMVLVGLGVAQGLEQIIFTFHIWLLSLPIRLLNWIMDAMNNLGRSIVEGIWHGILNAGNWLLQQIQGFIKTFLIEPVSRILISHSPSRLFMEIGKNVVAGLAIGITDNAHMVGSALDVLGGQFDVAYGLGGPVGMGSGGRAVVIHPGAVVVHADGADGATVTKTVERGFEKLIQEMQKA